MTDMSEHIDYTAPDKNRCALLTIDVQNDFVLPGAPAEIAGAYGLVPAMRDLLLAFREAELPIVHVVRLYKPDGSNAELCRRGLIERGNPVVCPGAPGAELLDDLKPDLRVQLDSHLLLSGKLQQVGKREWIMYKPRWGAFYRTGLEWRLRELGVHTIVVSGCNFPNCPRTTIYEASERDFRVVMVTDAVSGLYAQALKEMSGIGVHLMSTAEFRAWCKA